MDQTNKSTSLKEFRILKKIGQGSFGKVYKVLRLKDNQKYAMKTINISNMDKKSILNTMNEIRILSSIENENICGYKEAFLSKNSKEMNIIMEYIGGGDLSQKIKNL